MGWSRRRMIPSTVIAVAIVAAAVVLLFTLVAPEPLPTRGGVGWRLHVDEIFTGDPPHPGWGTRFSAWHFFADSQGCSRRDPNELWKDAELDVAEEIDGVLCNREAWYIHYRDMQWHTSISLKLEQGGTTRQVTVISDLPCPMELSAEPTARSFVVRRLGTEQPVELPVLLDAGEHHFELVLLDQE